MVKREITRICVVTGIGLVIAIFLLVSGGEKANLGMIVIPFYLVGMFYAAKILMKILGVVAKIYFSYQFMSLLINPLWGTVICLILLVLGVSAILIFGWLIGIGRCIYGLIVAYQIDQQCIDRNSEYYW